jgi:hypothetical protein
MHSVFLKRSLLLFWAVWLSIVFATNLLDGLKALGLLGESWAFASGNYRFLVETTARYGTPAWLNGLLFGSVVCWEGLAALLFWLALLTFRGKGEGRKRPLSWAFTVSLLLWGAFLIADEVFIAYGVAPAHWRPFTAQLATLLVVEVLPEDSQTKGEGASRPHGS